MAKRPTWFAGLALHASEVSARSSLFLFKIKASQTSPFLQLQVAPWVVNEPHVVRSQKFSPTAMMLFSRRSLNTTKTMESESSAGGSRKLKSAHFKNCHRWLVKVGLPGFLKPLTKPVSKHRCSLFSHLRESTLSADMFTTTLWSREPCLEMVPLLLLKSLDSYHSMMESKRVRRSTNCCSKAKKFKCPPAGVKLLPTSDLSNTLIMARVP